MKKAFCLITILAFMTTLNSGIRSANKYYNEGGSVRYYYWWNGELWKVQQSCSDYENHDNLSSHAGAAAKQWNLKHELAAAASYFSSYTNPKIKGTWYLRASLAALDWATDEEPFDKSGIIEGKKGGMKKDGSQSDTDWWATYDPIFSYVDIDAYASAEVTIPSSGVKHKAVAYSPAYPGGVTKHRVEKP